MRVKPADRANGGSMTDTHESTEQVELEPCPYRFGDFVGIEQKRYGAENEIYCYRVVSTDMSSSTFRAVPFDAAKPDCASQKVASVLLVVNASLTNCTSKMEYVRPYDVTPWPAPTRPPKPVEGRDVTKAAKRICLSENDKICDDAPCLTCSVHAKAALHRHASQQSMQGRLDAAREALKKTPLRAKDEGGRAFDDRQTAWLRDHYNPTIALIDQPEGERS